MNDYYLLISIIINLFTSRLKLQQRTRSKGIACHVLPSFWFCFIASSRRWIGSSSLTFSEVYSMLMLLWFAPNLWSPSVHHGIACTKESLCVRRGQINYPTNDRVRVSGDLKVASTNERLSKALFARATRRNPEKPLAQLWRHSKEQKWSPLIQLRLRLGKDFLAAKPVFANSFIFNIFIH